MKNDKTLDNFLSKYTTISDKDSCWLWNGPVDKRLGYGRTGYLGYPAAAHRVSYILANGDYEKIINNRKTCIRHLCSNRLCINPNHLVLGNCTENQHDASLLGRRIKMTKEKLARALELRKLNTKFIAIAAELGVTETTVRTSLRGKTRISRTYLNELS